MTEFRPSRYERLPVIVKNLIIINVLVVLIQFALGKYGIDLANYGGLHYWKSHYFGPWQILTHMFMHGSYNDVQLTFWHIFGNMFALWMFGSILENLWGPRRFLIFYLVCGIGAALCHLTVLGIEYGAIERAFHTYQLNPTLDQFNLFLTQQHIQVDPGHPLSQALFDIQQKWSQAPSSKLFSNESVEAINGYLYGYNYLPTHQYFQGIFDEPTVGASGAVFGVLFAFGYLFPNTLLYLYFAIPVKAKYVVGVYALYELFSGIRNSAGDNIAHFAHIGGMIFAFILLKIWSRKNRNQFY